MLMEMFQHRSPSVLFSFRCKQTEGDVCASCVSSVQEIRARTTFKTKQKRQSALSLHRLQPENSIFLPRCSTALTIVIWTKATFFLPCEMFIGHISTRSLKRWLPTNRKITLAVRKFEVAQSFFFFFFCGKKFIEGISAEILFLKLSKKNQ